MFKLCVKTLSRNTNIRCVPSSKSRIIISTISVKTPQKRYSSSGNDGDEIIKAVACVIGVGLFGLIVGGENVFKIFGGIAIAACVAVASGVFIMSCAVPMFWPVYFLLFMCAVAISKK